MFRKRENLTALHVAKRCPLVLLVNVDSVYGISRAIKNARLWEVDGFEQAAEERS